MSRGPGARTLSLCPVRLTRNCPFRLFSPPLSDSSAFQTPCYMGVVVSSALFTMGGRREETTVPGRHRDSLVNKYTSPAPYACSLDSLSLSPASSRFVGYCPPQRLGSGLSYLAIGYCISHLAR